MTWKKAQVAVMVMMWAVLLVFLSAAAGTRASLEERVDVLEKTMIACCSTEYRDMAAEGMVSALGRLRGQIDELKMDVQVLERFLEGKGE